MIRADSDRKAAFESELIDISIDLRRLRVHGHVPEKFDDVKEDIQVNILGVLSAMLDLIGRQLSHLEKFRAGFSFNSFLYADFPQAGLLLLFLPTLINGIRMPKKNSRNV